MATESRWLGNVSDLMSGLMIVFLFIAVVFMLLVEEEKQKIVIEKDTAEQLSEKMEEQGATIKEITATYDELQKGLYEQLMLEFAEDLNVWGASIELDSTFVFNEPDILFETGNSSLKIKFTEILNDFFPRYLDILTSDIYKYEINELRIEGHTSTQWKGAEDLKSRYLKNANLSQKRSFSVLGHCFALTKDEKLTNWLIKHFRANGLSFSNPVLVDGLEDKRRSRRVEFRVITKSEDKIFKIIEVQSERNDDQ